MGESRFERAIERIDEVNRADPRSAMFGGVSWPVESLHSERMTVWLDRLEPDAGEAQRLAARAHHLRRWERPRSNFPDGRAGYLRWRAAARAGHADEVAAILRDVGYDRDLIVAVEAIVRKEGPGASTHEDALCLVFLELQAADFLATRELADAQRIASRTVAKMSPAACRIGSELPLPAWVHDALVAAATGGSVPDQGD